MKYSMLMMIFPLLLAGTVVWAAGPGPARTLAGLECPQFDPAYAQKMKQSNCAEEIGKMKAVNQPMKQQAEFLTRKTADWTFRLDRWVSDNGYA